jgi:hypothetical protein
MTAENASRTLTELRDLVDATLNIIQKAQNKQVKIGENHDPKSITKKKFRGGPR